MWRDQERSGVKVTPRYLWWCFCVENWNSFGSHVHQIFLLISHFLTYTVHRTYGFILSSLLKSVINHYFIITENIKHSVMDFLFVADGQTQTSQHTCGRIARAWFPLQQKITVKKIEEEWDEYGLLPPPEGTKLREALIHFGKELVCYAKQPAGLTRSDVTRLLD